MALWSDTVQSVLDLINGAAVYDLNNSTTPSNFGLVLVNLAKDMLSKEKKWNDLTVRLKVSLDSEMKVTLPADIDGIDEVYIAVNGTPSVYFSLNGEDPTTMYWLETTEDSSTGALTRKICFPPNSISNQDLYIKYVRVIPDYTEADLTKKIMFPKGLMLCAAKKAMLDNFGRSGQEEKDWILARYQEELAIFIKHNHNANMDYAHVPKDSAGNRVSISGVSVDGKKTMNIPSNIYPNTFGFGGR
jgi:hypothetical protein